MRHTFFLNQAELGLPESGELSSVFPQHHGGLPRSKSVCPAVFDGNACASTKIKSLFGACFRVESGHGTPADFVAACEALQFVLRDLPFAHVAFSDENHATPGSLSASMSKYPLRLSVSVFAPFAQPYEAKMPLEYLLSKNEPFWAPLSRHLESLAKKHLGQSAFYRPPWIRAALPHQAEVSTIYVANEAAPMIDPVGALKAENARLREAALRKEIAELETAMSNLNLKHEQLKKALGA